MHDKQQNIIKKWEKGFREDGTDKVSSFANIPEIEELKKFSRVSIKRGGAILVNELPALLMVEMRGSRTTVFCF